MESVGIMNQTKKKIKLSKVREIIASRLRDDLRQPTLLKSAIAQGKKERESGIPLFTKRVNNKEEEKKLVSSSKSKTQESFKQFVKPVSISKMIG
ncbi:MAG: hypothetical protein MK033_00230 [Candidatus Caenarcaniphilales bacterium]|nr:hypothetical protein [Candidatus Caenarcaniphilales bacterium]